MITIDQFQKKYPFSFDDFQVQAMKHIDRGCSVIVSAPTGSGKTVIAEYAIEKALEKQGRIIYTTPLKALSNQKFRDFKERFGPDRVGLITGDITINRDAWIVIMTTEIFRNILYQDIGSINDVIYAVLDEIHYICDEERGTVWEEVIISCPREIPLVCLSASIGEIERFARWVSQLKGRDMEVILHYERVVPLIHYYYWEDELYALITPQGVERATLKSLKRKINAFLSSVRPGQLYHKYAGERWAATLESSIVSELRNRDMLPAIYFKFSRKGCDLAAFRLSNQLSLPPSEFPNPNKRRGDKRTKRRGRKWTTGSASLITEEEQRSIEAFTDYFAAGLTGEELKLDQTKNIFSWAKKGIGVHHAGLIPALKEYVERLFNQGLLKIVFATETLALGINMPARTTVISSFAKYTSTGQHRPLTATEYIQLTGRAGRRGIDEIGYALIPFEVWTPLAQVVEIATGEPEPITSNFRFSYNTILNLIQNHGYQNALPYLKKSFAYFLARQHHLNLTYFDLTFYGIVAILEEFGYLEEKSLTEKGFSLRQLHGNNELLLAEIVEAGLLDELSPGEIGTIVSALVYDSDKRDRLEQQLPARLRHRVRLEIERIFRAIQRRERRIGPITAGPNFRSAGSIYLWSQGLDFGDLCELSSLDEGDIIRNIRQTVEMMREMLKYLKSEDPLVEKVKEGIEILYRDLVVVRI